MVIDATLHVQVFAPSARACAHGLQTLSLKTSPFSLSHLFTGDPCCFVNGHPRGVLLETCKKVKHERRVHSCIASLPRHASNAPNKCHGAYKRGAIKSMTFDFGQVARAWELAQHDSR